LKSRPFLAGAKPGGHNGGQHPKPPAGVHCGFILNRENSAGGHDLTGLTKTVALELATFGVTCNCISPGYVWTPLVEKQISDTAKARGITDEQVKRDVLLAAQPTKEFVTVEEVADLAVYLSSDAAKAITGANIPIDGGWTAA
jgi:3-hydroxybutyrate dehydrogenase